MSTRLVKKKNQSSLNTILKKINNKLKLKKKDDILIFLCQNVSNTSGQPTAKVIPTGNDGNPCFNRLAVLRSLRTRPMPRGRCGHPKN